MIRGGSAIYFRVNRKTVSHRENKIVFETEEYVVVIQRFVALLAYPKLYYLKARKIPDRVWLDWRDRKLVELLDWTKRFLSPSFVVSFILAIAAAFDVAFDASPQTQSSCIATRHQRI